jgi:hypothetical protein
MIERSEYKRRLIEVKKALPKYYGVIMKQKRPLIKSTKVYNVVDKGTYNEEVLCALEEEFLPVEEKICAKKLKH